MTMHPVTPPAIEPVTIDEARAYLRITNDSENELLQSLIKTARETVEARAGLALVTQSWRLHIDRWPRSNRLALYRYPVTSIDAITAYLPDGTPVAFDVDDWKLQQAGRPQRLYLQARADMASLSGLEIDLTAGFGADAAAVPDVLKQAILVLVAHLYEFRGAFDEQSQPISFPKSFERLVDIWKRVSI